MKQALSKTYEFVVKSSKLGASEIRNDLQIPLIKPEYRHPPLELNIPTKVGEKWRSGR